MGKKSERKQKEPVTDMREKKGQSKTSLYFFIKQNAAPK